MYFLVASGLSLIYGPDGRPQLRPRRVHHRRRLRGVVARRRRSATAFEDARSSSATRSGSSVGAALGGRSSSSSSSVRSTAADRAGARHRRTRALARGARLQGSGAPIRADLPVPDWMFDTTTILGANIPNDRFVEIAVAVDRCSSASSAFLRFTRVGLIIRAGVENRAMVTALGIDVREDVHARLRARRRARRARRRPLGRLLRQRRSREGNVAPHLRLHRRRHRRVRVDRRLGGRRGRGRARPAVRELLRRRLARLERRGRPRGDVLLLAAVLLLRPERPRAEGGALMRGASSYGTRVPAAVLALLVVVPFLAVRAYRVVLQRARSTSPGTLQLLALCLVFAGVALTYDLLLRLHRAPLVRARALLRARRLRDRDRAHARGSGAFRQTLAFLAVVAVAAAARARCRQPARRRDRLRDGHARLRPGRHRDRPEESRRLDRRRGGDRPERRRAPGLRSSASSTRSTSTGSPSPTRRSCS